MFMVQNSSLLLEIHKQVILNWRNTLVGPNVEYAWRRSNCSIRWIQQDLSMSSTKGMVMAKPKQGVETPQFGGTLLILAMCKDCIYLWFISVDPWHTTLCRLKKFCWSQNLLTCKSKCIKCPKFKQNCKPSTTHHTLLNWLKKSFIGSSSL